MKKRSRSLLLSQTKKIDFPLLLLIMGFCIFGLIFLYNASSVSALHDFGNSFYYVYEQAKWLVIGLIGLSVSTFFNYKRWYYLTIPFMLITIFLLIMVFIPGVGITAYGAKRWLNFGILSLQPAELAKLSIIIYLSAWLSNKERSRLGAFLFLLGLILGLVILQPDFGTAIIIACIALVLYFLSDAPLVHFLLLLPLSIGMGLIIAVISPYRFQRLLTFINPNSDPLGSSYHIRQIILSLGSGGLFGLGIGKSRQKYAYLPEATTDSIFAIIAEEIGFVGSLIFIVILLLVIYRIFKIARLAPDKYSYLLGMGIAFWISIQTLINLSAMTALFPITGIPLPFISYGGSGLIVTLFAMGIVLNISKYRKEK